MLYQLVNVMKTYLLIPVVWASLAVFAARAQHDLPHTNGSNMPITSQSLLMRFPSTPAAPSLIIDKKYRRQSQITAFTANGDTLFSGGYKRGRLHGTWMSWYHPGQLCDSGRLVRNVPDGEWKSWYKHGQPRSIRTYSAFLLHRIKNEIPRRSSKATYFAITDIARTDPAYAWRLLTPVYSYATLAVNAIHTHAPEIRSLEARTAQNVTGSYHPYLPPFTACVHHGLYMNYYPDGRVKDSGLYHNGLRQGVWVEWLNNGTLRSTGAYHRGLKQGSWKYYTASGRMAGLKMYNRRGREIASKRFKPFTAASDAWPAAAQ